MNDKHSDLITLEQLEKNKRIVELANDEEASYDFDNIYMKIMSWKNDNEIGGSLMEIICEFSEAHNYDITDVGESLKKDKQFIKIFKNDLFYNNQIRLEEDDNTIQETSVGDWM